MVNSIEINNLSHRFGSVKTINNINLNVPQGSIFGFLGKNGAGKTTVLKLALGLLKKQKGEIVILGGCLKNNRLEILKKVGSLIEAPSFYGHLTASKNLSLLQRIHQCPKERVEEVLDLVGLSNSGNKKVNQFSLGMKQRLGIGMALIHDPQILILDEPTNGLDPKGIIEIRKLLKKLNAELGVTVLLSSHLLSEIEKLVTHVAIINNGELLFEGTMKSLKSKAKPTVDLETKNIQKAMEILRDKNFNFTLEGSIIKITNLMRDTIPELVKELTLKDIAVYGIREQPMNLESLFIGLTQD